MSEIETDPGLSDAHLSQNGQPAQSNPMESGEIPVEERSRMVAPTRPENSTGEPNTGVRLLEIDNASVHTLLNQLREMQDAMRAIQSSQEQTQVQMRTAKPVSGEEDRQLDLLCTRANVYDKTLRVKPLNLDMKDIKEGHMTPREKVSAFKRAFEDYARVRRIQPAEWTRAAVHFLEGRLEATYQRKFDANHGKHLSWEDFVKMLEAAVKGTEKTMFEVYDKLQNFRLIGDKDNPTPTLAEGLQQLDALMDLLPDLPGSKKCHFLYEAVPNPLKIHLQYDVHQGARAEWVDYERMKEALLSLQKAYTDYLRDLRNQRKPHREQFPKRPKFNHHEVHFMQQSSAQGNRPPYRERYGARPFQPESVPVEARRREYRPGDRFWAKQVDAQLRRQRQAKGLCLLCGQPGHPYRNCPSISSLYEKGEMFFYSLR